MGTPAESASYVRFGEFKLDLRTRELRSNGHRSYLQEQPFQVLAVLLDRPGQLITRDELMKQLWPSDTFVDFDRSLNKAVNRLREALDDSADHPRFIETVPRRGYRFIGPLAHDNVVTGDDRAVVERLRKHQWKVIVPFAVLLVAALVGGGLYWRSRPPHRPAGKETIVLGDFVNNTSDPVFEDALRQALLASLDQSPFISVLSDDKVREQLEYMGRSTTDRLTEPVAREVCQRAGSTIVLVGSISSLGSHYALGLDAVNCQTGESMSRQEAEVESREKILQGVDRVSAKTREQLGESLSSIQTYDVPLDQATTSSLEALRFFRLGLKADDTQGSAAGAPFYKQAIALDPNFAEAYEALSTTYGNFGEADLARTYLKRAMELSNRTSARERLDISATYYLLATRELDKAIGAHQLWERTYPGDRYAPMNLADAYLKAGQYEQCAAASHRAIGIDANASVPYGNLAICLVNLDRFDSAKKVVDEAFSRKLDELATLLHFLFNRGYGYFRDELYYAVCGQHLAWGYVDHAPLVAVVAHFTRAILGDSLAALRFVPALSGAAKVVTAGWMAREMGGTSHCPILRRPHHFDCANLFDLRQLSFYERFRAGVLGAVRGCRGAHPEWRGPSSVAPFWISGWVRPLKQTLHALLWVRTGARPPAHSAARVHALLDLAGYSSRDVAVSAEPAVGDAHRLADNRIAAFGDRRQVHDHLTVGIHRRTDSAHPASLRPHMAGGSMVSAAGSGRPPVRRARNCIPDCSRRDADPARQNLLSGSSVCHAPRGWLGLV